MAETKVTTTSKPIITEDPEVRRKLFWGAGLFAFVVGALYHVSRNSKSYVKGHGDGFVSGYRAAGGADNVALPSPRTGREIHQLSQDAESHHDE